MLYGLGSLDSNFQLEYDIVDHIIPQMGPSECWCDNYYYKQTPLMVETGSTDPQTLTHKPISSKTCIEMSDWPSI